MRILPRYTFMLFLVLLVSCSSSKDFASTTTTETIARLDTLDSQYKTRWRTDTFVTNATIDELDKLEASLQTYARELQNQNRTAQALFVASRGWMVQAQRLNAQQKQYDVETVATVAETVPLVRLDCGRADVYSRAAQVIDGSIYAAEQSARTFGQMQTLATQQDLKLIGVPLFYSKNIAGLYSRASKLRRAASQCENQTRSDNVVVDNVVVEPMVTNAT